MESHQTDVCHFRTDSVALHLIVNWSVFTIYICCLWPPYGIGKAIIFLPCDFDFLNFK